MSQPNNPSWREIRVATTGTEWTFTADTALVPAETNDQMSSVKILAP